jgi:hypothetical protein
MKFIFIKLKIKSEYYIHEALSTHGIEEEVDIIEFANNIAASYYEVHYSYMEYDYYYFHGGRIGVKVSEVREITQLEYNILNQFIY